jgi:hypothetical protein
MMTNNQSYLVALSKDEIESIIKALHHRTEWDTPSRLLIITKLERRLRQIASHEAMLKNYNETDIQTGI